MPLLIYVSMLVMRASDVAMLTAAKEMYDKVSMALWPFVGIALLLRLFYNQVTFGGTRKVAEVLIALFSYAVLIYSTPQVLSVVMNSAQSVADKISQEPPSIADTDRVLKTDFSPGITMNFNDWIVGLSQVWAQMIMTFLESIRIFALCGLFALAPIFIFVGTILGFEFYRKVFFTVIITVALWPVFSATLGTFALTIFKTKEQATLLSKAMLLFVYSTLQGVVPFFTFQQALQPVSNGLSSFGGLVGSAAQGIGGVVGFGQGFMSGLTGDSASQNTGGGANQSDGPIENQTSS